MKLQGKRKIRTEKMPRMNEVKSCFSICIENIRLYGEVWFPKSYFVTNSSSTDYFITTCKLRGLLWFSFTVFANAHMLGLA